MNTTTLTMTKEQAIEALIASTDKKTNQYPNRKNSNSYKTAMACLENLGEWQVCGESMGSGNYASSKTWQAETVVCLMRAGIVAEVCNVAPKGGKRGDRIRVTL